MKNTMWNKAKHQKITPCLSCKVWRHKTLYFFLTNQSHSERFIHIFVGLTKGSTFSRPFFMFWTTGKVKWSWWIWRYGPGQSSDQKNYILPHHQTCSLFSSHRVYYLQLSRLLCKSNSGSKNGGNYLYLIKIYENNVHGAVKKQ